MPALSTVDLRSMIERDEDFVLINTLPAKYFEETKLPEAINIPQDQEDFVQSVEQAAGDKDKTIVVYCANLECDSSTEAAKKLDHVGFTKVYDYRVGAKGWQQDDAETAAKTTG